MRVDRSTGVATLRTLPLAETIDCAAGAGDADGVGVGVGGISPILAPFRDPLFFWFKRNFFHIFTEFYFHRCAFFSLSLNR